MAKLRIVGEEHYICRSLIRNKEVRAEHPLEALKFRLRHEIHMSCEHAVIAMEKGELVGFFRFDHYYEQNDRIHASGTWIKTDQRRHGLATRMWMYALHRMKVRSVSVSTVTRPGTYFIQNLAKLDPRITDIQVYSK